MIYQIMLTVTVAFTLQLLAPTVLSTLTCHKESSDPRARRTDETLLLEMGNRTGTVTLPFLFIIIKVNNRF